MPIVNCRLQTFNVQSLCPINSISIKKTTEEEATEQDRTRHDKKRPPLFCTSFLSQENFYTLIIRMAIVCTKGKRFCLKKCGRVFSSQKEQFQHILRRGPWTNFSHLLTANEQCQYDGERASTDVATDAANATAHLPKSVTYV